MSDIDTARLRAEIAEWRAVGFKTDDYPLDTVRLMRLLDRVDELERTAAAAGRALREANEREAVSHAVVAGALFDLMGWLTSRDEAILLCGRVHAGPAADALKEWAEMRGLDIRGARVQDWHVAIALKEPAK